MFRAIKDILSEGKREETGMQREGKYYETGAGTTGVLSGTTGVPGAGFSPVETKEFTKEGYPVILERREAGPIVKEIIHPTEKVEIQHVVKREREQVEVRELTQPILEKAALPPQFHEQLLPEERKVMLGISADAIEEPLRKAKEGLAPSKTREVPIRTVEEKPPIIEESFRKKVYEEIVPIVERHVTEPHIIKEKKPIYEKVVEGPFFVMKELPRIEREAPFQYGEQLRYEGQRGGAGYGAGRYGGYEQTQQKEYKPEGGYKEYKPEGGYKEYKMEGGYGYGKGLVDIPIRTGTAYTRTTELQPEQVRHAY